MAASKKPVKKVSVKDLRATKGGKVSGGRKAGKGQQEYL